MLVWGRLVRGFGGLLELFALFSLDKSRENWLKSNLQAREHDCAFEAHVGQSNPFFLSSNFYPCLRLSGAALDQCNAHSSLWKQKLCPKSWCDLCIIYASWFISQQSDITKLKYLTSPILLAPAIRTKSVFLTQLQNKAEGAVCWRVAFNGFIYQDSQ